MPRPATPEKEDESFAEQKAIAATLERYISGARTGDVGLMRVVFVATARISGTYDGKPVEWTVEEFCGIVERGGPAEGLEAQIVAIEYVGNAGMARLEARNWRGTRYTDFFVLSKQAENWRINSKVFYAHSRAYKRRAWTEANMFEYRLEHIMSYAAKLGTREAIGNVPDGVRVNVHVIGGEVTGPRISGTFRSLSGDWLTIRRDGVAILDIRATIETHDGALIYVTYLGTADRGEDGYEKALQGEPMASGTAIHISPRFQASHPNYVWLNRLHCLGIGRAFPERSEVA